MAKVYLTSPELSKIFSKLNNILHPIVVCYEQSMGYVNHTVPEWDIITSTVSLESISACSG